MEKSNYFEKIKKWRKKLANHQENKEIIWDLRIVPWISWISEEFVNVLSLRQFLWWWFGEKFIFPSTLEKSGNSLYEIIDYLTNILKIKKNKIEIGDFKTLSEVETREPYMKTEIAYPEIDKINNKAIENILKTIAIVKLLWDKWELAKLIKNQWLDKLLPNNTKIFNLQKIKWTTEILYDFPESLIEEIKDRLEKEKSFIIKLWEGASWENIVVIKVKTDSIEIKNSKEIKKIDKNLNKEKLLDQVIKFAKKTFTENTSIKISENLQKETKPQNIVVQDRIEWENLKEHSINFFIKKEKEEKNIEIYLTTSTNNLTEWVVHVWNEETILSPNVYLNFEILLQKIFTELLERYQLDEIYLAIWFDFIYDYNTWKINILECNPRYTAPLSPSMLVERLEQIYDLPYQLTWKLIQKFKISKWIDLLDPNLPKNIKNYILAYENIWTKLKNWEPGIVVYTPPFSDKWNNYQSIIVIWKDESDIKDLLDKLSKLLLQ